MTAYSVNYNAKDIILYALSIGINPSPEDSAYDDLRFLYENHPQFECFPTFCLALTFWAEEKGLGSTVGMPAFPPPMMKNEDIIPRRCLPGGNVDLSSFHLIHSWQSIVWHQPMTVPSRNAQDPSCRWNSFVSTTLDTETISVAPKSVGTFVTSQTNIKLCNGKKDSQLCTMQSTALVLGIPPAQVLPFDSGVPRQTMSPQIPDDDEPILEFIYPTNSTEALLYRVASGDTNHIHVDTSAAEMLKSEKKAPLLHGLFTLAIGCRAVSKLIDPSVFTIKRLEGKFSQPAFVGDVLKVQVWNHSHSATTKGFVFVVLSDETDAEVLVGGYAEFIKSRKSRTPVSKL